MWETRPLEVVARVGDHIVQYTRPGIGTPWDGPTTIIVPDADQVRPVGNPVLVQRGFDPLAVDQRGQLELVTPMTGGTLAHFTRDPLQPWSSVPPSFGQELGVPAMRPFDAVTM